MVINWDDLQLNSKYWKPMIDQEYIIEIGNWRIEDRDFNNQTQPAKKHLILDVYSETNFHSGDSVSFTPALEFTTRNKSFIDSVKILIDKATQENKTTLFIQVKKTQDKRYSVFSFAPKMKNYVPSPERSYGRPAYAVRS